MRSSNESPLYSSHSKLPRAPEDLKGLQLVLEEHVVPCHWPTVLLLTQETSLAKHIPYRQSLLVKTAVPHLGIDGKKEKTTHKAEHFDLLSG